jgi:Tfp pilus assembly protein FimT
VTPDAWIGVGVGLLTAVGIGWQIRKDIRKDRAEQLAAAITAARTEALLEERVRQLESRDREHDDDA